TARQAPRRVGLEIGRLDPCGGERAHPTGAGRVVGYLHGPSEWGGGATPLHLAAQLAGLGERFADHPLAVSVEYGHEGVEGRRVVGEPALAERHRRAERLGRSAFEL